MLPSEWKGAHREPRGRTEQGARMERDRETKERALDVAAALEAEFAKGKNACCIGDTKRTQ